MDNLTGSARGLGPGAEIDGVTGDGAALMSDEQPSVPRQRAESWITQSPHQPQKWGDAMAHRETDAEQAATEPRPAAVTFVTTEHFTLQRAPRLNDRGGDRSSDDVPWRGQRELVALGLIATAAGVSTAFYAFALILLPTLAPVGLATFNRVATSGIEDFGYASRIARLRGYYFQYAPELVGYLLSVPPTERLRLQRNGGGPSQSS